MPRHALSKSLLLKSHHAKGPPSVEREGCNLFVNRANQWLPEQQMSTYSAWVSFARIQPLPGQDGPTYNAWVSFAPNQWLPGQEETQLVQSAVFRVGNQNYPNTVKHDKNLIFTEQVEERTWNRWKHDNAISDELDIWNGKKLLKSHTRSSYLGRVGSQF